MCGRFTLSSSAEDIAEAFGVRPPSELRPRYNIAPSQPSLVLKASGGARVLAWHRWGLVPPWAADLAIGNRLINARAETAADKPAFRAALRRRRCLIPASGFYEWAQAGKQKQPYLFALRDRRPFAFAGLWERWDKGGEEVLSCAILTTGANDVLRPVHDRMPVIVPADAYDRWLDPAVQDPAAVADLLAPYPAGEMAATPVSRRVNNPRFDDPACVEPQPPGPAALFP
jgi:putative SOS response-associated peptidase YedK